MYGISFESPVQGPFAFSLVKGVPALLMYVMSAYFILYTNRKSLFCRLRPRPLIPLCNQVCMFLKLVRNKYLDHIDRKLKND